MVIDLMAQDVGTVTGRVLDRDYTPMSNFRLWIRSSQNKSKGIHVTTDEFGNFEAEAPAGLLTLGAGSQGGAVIDGVELSSGGSRHIEVLLQE